MSERSPWDQITVPSQDRNVKLVEGVAAVPCYWARNASGSCLFIIELEGDFVESMRANLIRVKGIKIDLISAGQGLQQLILELQKEGDHDLFENFCRALVNSLTKAENSEAAFVIAWGHIRRWKAFFGGSVQQLSPELVQGLFAELLFLKQRIAAASIEDAIASWMGPNGGQQDFIYGKISVEVKSVMGTARNSVRISSLDQLESLQERLYLRAYILRTTPNSTSGTSLNQLVEDIRALIAESPALDDFERKLFELRYQPLPAYDKPGFLVSEVRTYQVHEDFPRLIRSEQSPWLANVSYDIKLEGLAKYVCDDVELKEKN